MRNPFKGQTFNDGPYNYRIYIPAIGESNTIYLSLIIEGEPTLVGGDLIMYMVNHLIQVEGFKTKLFEIRNIVIEDYDFGDITNMIFGPHGKGQLQTPNTIRELYTFAKANQAKALDIQKIAQTLKARIIKSNKTISFLTGTEILNPDTNVPVAKITGGNTTGVVRKDRYSNEVIVPTIRIVLTMEFLVPPAIMSSYQITHLAREVFAESCPIDLHRYDNFEITV